MSKENKSLNSATGINVLSLFDGISCGRVALDRAGIKLNSYYASEIEESVTGISRKHYPDIVRLGNVKDITFDLIQGLNTIDLVIGGSPCQGLSSSNVWLKDGEYGVNGTGKSNLFWDYVRVLQYVKRISPNVKFLLENVGSAAQKDRAIIDKVLGVTGQKFNSQLVSAQNRNRIYWTNIEFTVPEQRKNIFLYDVLEGTVDDKYYLSQKMYDCIMSPATKGWQSGRMEIDLAIARPLTATMHKMHRADTDTYVSTEYQPIGKTNVRRLTPLECERLQTLPDHYTKVGIFNTKERIISDTKRYQAIGNGWTVDAIAHILSFLHGDTAL